ncbi:MAG TPA: FAD-dependent oxidoreductase [Coriobacteriia bacterium]|nr:FAD-dependent oxidoreductase [Coriobacteriia bacterium]
MASEYSVKVLSVERCGLDILSVRLERPKEYAFKSGQWLRVFLETGSGREARTFSHASTGQDDWIEFTTRLSDSAFKQALGRVEAGDTIAVSGAGGRLSLSRIGEKAAFLVGGVGVTPVRSLLREALQTGKVFSDALVIYGNRDDSCEPYLDELREMEGIGVRLVRVLEHPRPESGSESGYITAELIARYVDPSDDRPYIIAGPPVMVDAMEAVLDELGVGKELRIIEAFGSRQPVG